jgi:RNA polymerase sigma-70 factor (ECF subfamily)
MLPMSVTTSEDVEQRYELVAAWFARYQLPLFRYLMRLLDDEESATDLLQETFLRALEKSDLAPENPSAWLYRVATNLAYDHLRRRRRLRWLPFRGDEQSGAFEQGVANAESVRRCLAQLPIAESEALLLYEWAGLSCAEIAAACNAEQGAIRMRLSRARARFCALYEKEVPDGLC